MHRVNEYRFYELGQKIRAISDIKNDSDYGDVWIALWEARDALNKLRQDVVAVRVSLGVVERLIRAITAIVPADVKEATSKMLGAEGSPPMTVGWPYYELNEALAQFEPVLAAECSALDTYVVSQKRGYSTPDLIDRCEVMVGADTLAVIGAHTIADIRAAGRCLAFDTPTAAGFHILRAVEAAMALYYTHLTGKQITKRNRNWGAYLKALEEASNVNPKVVGALTHIKDNYRNPITHPEDTLSESEAIMLFGLCLSVIELMAEALRSLPPMLTDLEQAKALTGVADQNPSEPPADF